MGKTTTIDKDIDFPSTWSIDFPALSSIDNYIVDNYIVR